MYKNRGWKSLGDWLGTGTISKQNREFRNLDAATEYARSLGLKTVEQWRNLGNLGKLPPDIPYSPHKAYEDNGWKGYGHFLGTGKIAPKDRTYRPIETAREYVNSLGLKGKVDWEKHCRTGKLPKDIPTHPDREYAGRGWNGWGDWLGTGSIAAQEKGWSILKVKELLRSLIESQIIYQWSEARLYKFLLTKGVLNLRYENRHNQFFKNLVEASRTQEGRRVIEEYAYSDSEVAPDLLKKPSDVDGDEIQSASTEELARLVNDNRNHPLDYGEIPTVEQVLASTSVLESINVDEEAMQFFLRGAVNDIWKRAFKDGGDQASEAVIKEGKNGQRFHDIVAETFLAEYQSTENIEIPNGYAFGKKPTLMQKYVAYMISTNSSFGNFSGTGAGKTLSAILASRVIDSKMTVIVCPNDIVGQWMREIYHAFPQSTGTDVKSGKEAFYAIRDENKHKYLVLNYDKFNQQDSPNLILELKDQKIDFVILDEIHYAKTRSEDEISQRTENLTGLLTGIKRKNNDIKVLGLTATPVVNNLTEGKSLLQMITGKIYDDVATKSTVPNAVTLYEKLSTISIREMPDYKVVTEEKFIEVDADIPASTTANNDTRPIIKNPLSTEKFLTEARMQEIIKNIDRTGSTIIYTEYVGDGIVKKLSQAVKEEGYRVAFHTGSDHSGKPLFLDKKVQVLIASSPLSVGVDGLQTVCNRIIINSLPWTNARYQQLVGRLRRIGQKMDVIKIFIIRASLKYLGKRYDYDQKKWNRIEFKRTLADCAVDGILPERNLVTPEQAHKEALRWLERLERGEVSTISRRDLEVELTPTEIKYREIKYGDLSKQHQRINSELSDTTHKRMENDPAEWLEYHRKLKEKRETWSIDPLEEIIARVKTISPKWKIGDFGCGEAKLMEQIGSDRVVSFDHVAVNDKVMACDIKSVSRYIEDGGLEVVVFSLSLMGKNWRDYIVEAKRCLPTRGSMLIAETTESLSNGGRLSELRDVIKEQGFVIDVDEERGDFTFIEATKV
jgi:superfamily II DNA or RNA helicase